MSRSDGGLGLLGGREDEDLLSGVANLFDIGIVFALGFMVALISAMNLLDIFSPNQRVTITKERQDGMEVIIRDGQTTTIRRMTKTVGSGDGVRLGTAYRLDDGSVIYVPEGDAVAQGDGADQ